MTTFQRRERAFWERNLPLFSPLLGFGMSVTFERYFYAIAMFLMAIASSSRQFPERKSRERDSSDTPRASSRAA